MSESTPEIPRQTIRRRPLLLASAVFVLAGISVLVYGFWPVSPAKNASNPTSVAGSSPGQTAPAGAGSSPGTAPAEVAGSQGGAPALPVGPVGLKPRDPAHVATWNAGQGGATLAAISASLGTALMAHGADQFAQMRQACVSLASEVASASTQPPIPDSNMQILYKKALTSLAVGAAKCEAGISSHLEGDEDLVIHTDPVLLDAAMSQLDIGARELYSATYRIRTLGKT
jgi:hypothetical protein